MPEGAYDGGAGTEDWPQEDAEERGSRKEAPEGRTQSEEKAGEASGKRDGRRGDERRGGTQLAASKPGTLLLATWKGQYVTRRLEALTGIRKSRAEHRSYRRHIHITLRGSGAFASYDVGPPLHPARRVPNAHRCMVPVEYAWFLWPLIFSITGVYPESIILLPAAFHPHNYPIP